MRFIRAKCGNVEADSRFRADPKTAGDCPNFAESSEENGTVPFSEAVFG